ncbi:hypothetical protein K501DRAFT_334654 [Backusella circina FSU 941]|nr:hypothetical protein K501DRAFT_334654 [Backusella circina FSU 941]
MSHQFLPVWPSSHVRPESTTTSEIHEEVPENLTMDELQQGELYIVKCKLVVIALFQGWNDEMCCFSILRTDMIDDLRWYEARLLPMNFDAFPAFDYAGNPSIFLFPKHLRAIIPINWFNIFEEARHAQRAWKDAIHAPKKSFYILDHSETGDAEQEVVDTSDENREDAGEKDDLSQGSSSNSTKQGNEATDKPQTTAQEKTAQEEPIKPKENEEKQEESSPPVAQKKLTDDEKQLSMSPLPLNPMQLPTPLLTPPRETMNQFPARAFHGQVLTSSQLPPQHLVSPTHILKEAIEDTPAKTFQRQVSQQSQIKSQETLGRNRSIKPKETPKQQKNSIQQPEQEATRPEINKRRSFSSFFRKKSKKNADKKEIKEHKKEEKRKSAPPSTAASVKSAIPKQEEPPLPKQKEEVKLNQNNMMKKKSMDKLEIFDYETFFDMQATFAFLNSNDPFEKFENTLTSIPVTDK